MAQRPENYTTMSNKKQCNDTHNNEILSVSFANSEYNEKLNMFLRESVALVFKTNNLPVQFISTENGFMVVKDKSIDIKLEGEHLVKMEMPEEVDRSCDETFSKQNGRNLFRIDYLPARNIVSTVPIYDRSFQTVLDGNNSEKDAQENYIIAPRSSITCFNCGGEHHMRDCTFPRNSERILNASNQFNNKKGERCPLSNEKKYSHIKPGKLSSQLRNALGLKDWELPPFTYRMRTLGYPPGWLEEAKIEHSGLKIYNSNEERKEDGEVNIVQDQYDITKIIKIPGFNVDAPANMRDDSKFRNVPQMLPAHRIENFIKSINATIPKGYKKENLEDFPSNTSDNNRSNYSPVDMQIEDALPLAQYGQPATRNLPTAPTELLQSSPLQYLEEEHCRISNKLKYLEEQETDNESNATNKSLKNKYIVESNVDSVENTSTCRKNDSTENDSIYRLVKMSFMGTPLLKFSQYESLPSLEKFSEGISDVINFENLSDSTGKYDKIKGIIKKVREVDAKSDTENE